MSDRLISVPCRRCKTNLQIPVDEHGHWDQELEYCYLCHIKTELGLPVSRKTEGGA